MSKPDLSTAKEEFRVRTRRFLEGLIHVSRTACFFGWLWLIWWGCETVKEAQCGGFMHHVLLWPVWLIPLAVVGARISDAAMVAALTLFVGTSALSLMTLTVVEEYASATFNAVWDTTVRLAQRWKRAKALASVEDNTEGTTVA